MHITRIPLLYSFSSVSILTQISPNSFVGGSLECWFGRDCEVSTACGVKEKVIIEHSRRREMRQAEKKKERQRKNRPALTTLYANPPPKKAKANNYVEVAKHAQPSSVEVYEDQDLGDLSPVDLSPVSTVESSETSSSIPSGSSKAAAAPSSSAALPAQPAPASPQSELSQDAIQACKSFYAHNQRMYDDFKAVPDGLYSSKQPDADVYEVKHTSAGVVLTRHIKTWHDWDEAIAKSKEERAEKLGKLQRSIQDVDTEIDRLGLKLEESQGIEASVQSILEQLDEYYKKRGELKQNLQKLQDSSEAEIEVVVNHYATSLHLEVEESRKAEFETKFSPLYKDADEEIAGSRSDMPGAEECREKKDSQSDREVTMAEAIPQGFHIVLNPELTDLASIHALVGRKIIFKWSQAGWALGVFVKAVGKSKSRSREDLKYTMQVKYPEDNSLFNHKITVDTYSAAEDAKPGAWCLLAEDDAVE
eukprot:g80879.t1